MLFCVILSLFETIASSGLAPVIPRKCCVMDFNVGCGHV